MAYSSARTITCSDHAQSAQMQDLRSRLNKHQGRQQAAYSTLFASIYDFATRQKRTSATIFAVYVHDVSNGEGVLKQSVASEEVALRVSTPRRVLWLAKRRIQDIAV